MSPCENGHLRPITPEELQQQFPDIIFDDDILLSGGFQRTFFLAPNGNGGHKPVLTWEKNPWRFIPPPTHI